MTEDVVCNRCGCVNEYYTEKSGPHIKATCIHCDRYIKFLKQKTNIMGLEKASGRKNFLSIADGKLVLQHQNPIEGTTVERINKNGRTVHEEFFTSITAHITAVQSEETTFGKVWEVELKDENGETYLLSFNYSSRYTNNFFRALPNVNLEQPVKLSPWSMKDKQDASKKVIGLSLYQEACGGKVPFAFDKENPGAMPEMKQTKLKGKTVWDDSDQLEFFENMAKELFGKTAVAAGDTDDSEDAPF
jgi:hypothetical protein